MGFIPKEVSGVMVMDMRLQRPSFQMGELPGWDESVFTVDQLADNASAFKDGMTKLRADEMPKKLVLSTRWKEFQDAFYSASGVNIMSKSAADILEEFDPGVHQFFPIEVFWKNGDPVPGEWRIFHVTHEEDAIQDEGTKAYFQDQGPIRLPSGELAYFKGYRRHPISFEKKQVTVDPTLLSGKAHFWRERRFMQSFLCTRALWETWSSEGLKVFKAFPAKLPNT